MHPVQTAGETGTGTPQRAKLSNNTPKRRVGRLPQSYLLQSIFLSTLTGQAMRGDGNTGS